MDKKFLLSVGLSLVTVWVLQYYWYKPTPVSGEISLKTAQAVPKPGEPIRVPVREDLLKPLKTDALFDHVGQDAAPSKEIVIETKQHAVMVASHGGGITGLGFKKYAGKTKKPLMTITPEFVAKSIPAFALAFDESAPQEYAVVDADQGATNTVALQAAYKNWVVTKEIHVDEASYAVDVVLRFEPKNQDAGSLRPRLFVPAPVVTELGEDQPSVFLFNEHRSEVEKKSVNEAEGLAWYWQSPQALVGMHDKYFVHALTSDAEKFVQRAYFHRMGKEGSLALILEGPEVKDKAEWRMSFYMGPKVYSDLTQVDERLGTIAAGGWLAWITKLMLKFLDFVNKYVKNLGFAIIVLALLLKLPLTPLSIYSRIKMERYQKHAPIINRIRSKFRSDPQMQMQEVSRYHHEHNISPSTPLIGCLPLLLQLPVMYSLYDILNNSIQLYQAPFWGWIVDLSAKDPFYIIPILMGISMVWQQAMAPVNDEKQRVAMFFVSIVMTVVFAGLPVGLVLYWLVNNLLTIIEDYVRRWFFA